MKVLNLGLIKGVKPLKMPANALTTHAFVTGMTGSGKTGNLLGIVEELARAAIPCLLVDVKGDLVNVAVQSDSELSEAMSVRYVTPGAYHGEAVNLMSGLGDAERITPTVTALLKLIGRNPDPIRSVEHAYLSTILQIRHEMKAPCSLVDLVKAIIDPGFESLGAMPLKQVIPLGERVKLASALNTVLCAPSFDPWKTGISLDIGEMLTPRADGKTPIVVYSVAHIVEDDERLFALSLLFDAVVSWSRGLEGSDDLRACMLVDECFGLLPPHPSNPPTKRPIITLLKQARAFGLGVVLATQNPVDLDYKALSNCGTWIVGRLQTPQDRTRVGDGLGASGFDKKTIASEISLLKAREFLFCRNNASYKYQTRDVTCALSGPISQGQIKQLYHKSILQPVDTKLILTQKLAEAKAMAEHDESEVWQVKIAQISSLLDEIETLEAG